MTIKKFEKQEFVHLGGTAFGTKCISCGAELLAERLDEVDIWIGEDGSVYGIFCFPCAKFEFTGEIKERAN